MKSSTHIKNVAARNAAAIAVIILFAVVHPARAAVEYVNGFGVGGWYSWDTRDTSGNQLVGTNDTNPAWPGWAGSNSTANDTAIEAQIKFMGEGQIVGDAGDVGNPPAASPTGSLNGLGYVRLDGTGSNSGKSDISYVNTSGIAPGGALIDQSFGLSYRYFIDPETTFRTLGLNISLIGTDSNQYTFAYVDPSAVTGWNTSSVSAGSGLFTVFENGSSIESGASKTLTGWSSDPTFGAAMFGSGSEVFRIGFNLGSFQRNNLQYLDWTQTNLLNNGDLIDFVAAPVPEPSVTSMIVLAALLAGGYAFRRRLSLISQRSS